MKSLALALISLVALSGTGLARQSTSDGNGFLGSGVLVEDYGSKTLMTDLGVVWARTSGVYDLSEQYASEDLECVTILDPGLATEVPVASANFIAVLIAAFPGAAGWSYATSTTPLSPGALAVRTYDASSAPVGAEFHVEYRPGSGDPTAIHWIQVVTSDHPTNAFLKVSHGIAENAVDIPAGQTNPYHHGQFATNNDDVLGGYDYSWRLDESNDHDFKAELWVCTGPAIGSGAGLITLHPPGIRWGWRNICSQGKIELGYLADIAPGSGPVRFATSGTFTPGAQLQAAAITPATMRLKKGSTVAPVQLANAQLSLAIGSALELDRKGSRFTVSGGSGQFTPYMFGGVPIGASALEVINGSGVIHWASGGIWTHLLLRVTAPGFDNILATADGTGSIDTMSHAITLDQVDMGVETEHAALPMASAWALGGLALLLCGAGYLAVRQRRAARAG